MNNFEKIKAMNIDEMAEFLKINASKLLVIYKVAEFTNQDGIKQWLESEVRE